MHSDVRTFLGFTSFSDRLLHALGDDAVKAKIYELVVQPGIITSLQEFGTGIGSKVGDILARFKEDFRTESSGQEEIKVLARGTVTPPVATVDDTEPANSQRNRKRRFRKQRTKEKYIIKRADLLQARPITSASVDLSINQRLGNLPRDASAT